MRYILMQCPVRYMHHNMYRIWSDDGQINQFSIQSVSEVSTLITSKDSSQLKSQSIGQFGLNSNICIAHTCKLKTKHFHKIFHGIIFNLLMLSRSLLLPHPTLLFPILLSLVLLNLMVPTILVGYLLLFLFFIAMMMVIIDGSDPCPSKFLHDALDEGGNPC